MDSFERPQVAILGSGIAGLTAAIGLQKAGIKVAVYEASNSVGGFAATFRDSDGFSYDFGAHFITNRLANAVGVGKDCHDVRHYGEVVLLRGRFHSYPMGLMLVPRFLGSALLGKVYGEKRGSEEGSAKEVFENQYGTVLAEEVAIPLVEAWSGEPASRLAPSVVEKIPHNLAHILMLRALSRCVRKAIAIGYCRERSLSHRVWHVYPEGGLRLLCEHLAQNLRGQIFTESPVSAIYVKADRVVGIRVKDRDLQVPVVVSSSPVTTLAGLIRGSDAITYLAKFRYRPMVFVMLKFRAARILPEVVVWAPGRTFPFFRLTEAPLSMPWLAPEGKTMITADIGCAVGDQIWTMQDEQLGKLCLEGIERIFPGSEKYYLGCRVLRTQFAYPIFLNEYETERRKLQESTGIGGLFSIGRNGEFDHLLTEDVYWRTLSKVPQILEFLRQEASRTPPTTCHATA